MYMAERLPSSDNAHPSAEELKSVVRPGQDINSDWGAKTGSPGTQNKAFTNEHTASVHQSLPRIAYHFFLAGEQRRAVGGDALDLNQNESLDRFRLY